MQQYYAAEASEKHNVDVDVDVGDDRSRNTSNMPFPLLFPTSCREAGQPPSAFPRAALRRFLLLRLWF